MWVLGGDLLTEDVPKLFHRFHGLIMGAGTGSHGTQVAIRGMADSLLSGGEHFGDGLDTFLVRRDWGERRWRVHHVESVGVHGFRYSELRLFFTLVRIGFDSTLEAITGGVEC